MVEPHPDLRLGPTDRYCSVRQRAYRLRCARRSRAPHAAYRLPSGGLDLFPADRGHRRASRRTDSRQAAKPRGLVRLHAEAIETVEVLGVIDWIKLEPMFVPSSTQLASRRMGNAGCHLPSLPAKSNAESKHASNRT